MIWIIGLLALTVSTVYFLILEYDIVLGCPKSLLFYYILSFLICVILGTISG